MDIETIRNAVKQFGAENVAGWIADEATRELILSGEKFFAHAIEYEDREARSLLGEVLIVYRGVLGKEPAKDRTSGGYDALSIFQRRVRCSHLRFLHDPRNLGLFRPRRQEVRA
jgi:hypothetical protein